MYVELYNRSGNEVTLMTEVTTETSSGVFISEDISWRIEMIGFEFPVGMTIASHSYIVVAKNPANYSD